MMPIGLKPCPFCGGPPSTFAREMLTHVPFDPRTINAEHGNAVEAHVFCHECGAKGETADSVEIFEEKDLEELFSEACKLWNQRDERHKELFEASAKIGNNIYPRAANDG